jgi:hypothetical protein
VVTIVILSLAAFFVIIGPIAMGPDIVRYIKIRATKDGAYPAPAVSVPTSP